MADSEENALLDDVLFDAMDDWLMAASVTGAIVRGRRRSSQEVRALALPTLRTALQEGLLIPGDVKETGFFAWEGSPAEWMARIETDWPDDRYPELGEVCWLNLTELGWRRGREIELERLGPPGV